MRIAYVSYEYPPDTAIGGIGTYVYQISTAMHNRGHEVEVFCSSQHRQSLDEVFENGIIVHRVRNTDRAHFRRTIVKQFTRRQAASPFDLVESPEYGAEGLGIKRRFPEVPMIVKCHTPSYLVKRLNHAFERDSPQERFKKLIGAEWFRYQKNQERRLTLLADRISSPSLSLAERIAADWRIPRSRIDVLPNVFVPHQSLLQIPVATNHRVVTFMGRLEVRKGVVALADAIPLALARHGDLRFRFVGNSGRAPNGKDPMLDFLQRKLAPHSRNIEFVSHVPLSEVPAQLAQTDICVFPSLWENFPNVCLEAMSAARGIVASQSGGMHDMLSDIEGGILIDPHDSHQIADGISALADQPVRRQAMAARCREKIVRYYAQDVARLTEDYYSATAARRR